MWHKIKRGCLQFGPGVILGLYLGRVSSELLPTSSLLATVMITGLAMVVAVYWLKQRPFHQTWPTLILLLYVLYPEADPRTALLVGGITGITQGLVSIDRQPNTNKKLLRGIIFLLVGVIFLAPLLVHPGPRCVASR